MGLVLDLTVAALALVVVGSLATLAWTLGVSSVAAVHRGRAEIAASRARVADAEARVHETAARASGTLSALSSRIPDRSSSASFPEAGEEPHA